ncbi:MAG: pseudouridine synthase [Bacteroidales bacterium]|nr:pseudouridine synthase [Bacteroidales bacterium]
MEENYKGGHEGHEERRDYANREPRTGYSSEGRKLRPRRKVSPASSHTEGEHRPYGHQNRGYGSRNEYHAHGGSDRRSNYGERSYGERSYGERSYGERSYGERSYGERSHDDSRGGYGARRPSHGPSRAPYGQGRPSYGQNHTSSFGGPRRSFAGDGQEGGERKHYGQGRPSYGQKNSYSRKPAGPKKFARRNDPHFTETDEAGINVMLSRRPQLDHAVLSDNDTVPTPIKEEVRLNKFIANSGVCSRREADNLIQAGVVTVNGVVVTELGTKVNVLKDDIRFNGERLKGEEKVYIVMNKPKGFVTSASDPHAEKTVMDLLKECTIRVFPVGRLDKNTTGVLMFTNDGEIAEQLTHPSYNKKKIYQVILDKALDEADKEKILNEGLELSDGVIKADELEYIDADDHRRLGIEIHSGKNRIVRRIFESLGYDVKALDRVYFAGLTKKGLKKGEWRYLSEGEVNVLKMGAYV